MLTVKLRLYRQLSRATHCALVRVCAALARASGQRSNSQPHTQGQSVQQAHLGLQY